MAGFKLYRVDGYDEPLSLSPEHAEELGAVELDTSGEPPKRSATQAEWAEYAKAQGMDPATAESSTRRELIEQFG